MLRRALVLLLAALAAPAAGAPPAAVPDEGATVAYHLTSSGGAPDGSFRQATDAHLTLRYADGTWSGTCAGTTTTWDGVTATTTSFEEPATVAPPTMPRGLRRGQSVDPVLLADAPDPCRHELGPLVVAGREKGRTLLATEPADASAYQDAALAWDARSGRVVSWSFAGRGGGLVGELVAS